VVPGRLHNLLDNVALLGATIGEPAAEGEDRDLETGRSKVAELHALGVVCGTDNSFRHFDFGCVYGVEGVQSREEAGE
jgi:hypothetical protein